MTQRTLNLPENEAIRVLLQAERYMQERKIAPQSIGTFNVRSELVGPLTWTGPLSSPSPQNPTTIGSAFIAITVTSHVMEDLFCRIFTKLTTSGGWYRPSNQLADVKAGISPAYYVQVFPIVVGVNTRSSRDYQVIIQGPLNATVTIDIWAVSLGGTG